MASTPKPSLQTRGKKLSPAEQKVFDAVMAALPIERPPPDTNVYTLDKLIASKESKGVKCPHCNSRTVVKFGIRREVQWYRCKRCEKIFSGLTKTFLDGTKKKFKVWKKFVMCMIDKFPIRKAAERCNIHRNTAFVWRHKILDALAHYQENQRLTGIVEADDTYVGLSFKGSEPDDREARQRGTPSPTPGISKDKVAVSCAIARKVRKDRKGRVMYKNGRVMYRTVGFYSKASSLGRPNAKKLRKVFGRVLPHRNRTTQFVTDKDSAYAKFAKENRYKHTALAGGLVRQGDYHVQNINSYHSHLKGFIRKFRSVSTKYLNNYLVWYNVIEKKKKNRVAILKLCIKPAAKVTRWAEISDRDPKLT